MQFAFVPGAELLRPRIEDGVVASTSFHADLREGNHLFSSSTTLLHGEIMRWIARISQSPTWCELFIPLRAQEARSNRQHSRHGVLSIEVHPPFDAGRTDGRRHPVLYISLRLVQLLRHETIA